MPIRKKVFLLLLCLSGLNAVKAQNYDLSQFKDFEQLAKVNPAFTGVLQRLRVLAANKGSDLNIGFEGKIFKTENYLGGGFNQLTQGSIRRQSLYASYNRDKKLKNEALLKIALQGEYNQKAFFVIGGQKPAYLFNDLDGQEFLYDSTNSNLYSEGRNYFDLGFGLAYQGKRFLFGANARHLNQPKYSINKENDAKLDIEANAQLCGFWKIGKTTLIPTGMLSIQGKDKYYQLGGGINYADYTLAGSYEMLNDLPLLDIGLNYRKGRIFAAVSYKADLKNSDGIDFSQIKLTLNTSLRKPKLEDKEVLKYLSYLY